MTVIIRKETLADIAAIEQVTTDAFLKAPHTSHTEQYIVDALRRAGQLAVSLVAEENGRIIGHVAVSPVTISSGARHWYGGGPLSVIPEKQGQGVGTLLMNAALQALRELGAEGCVLVGEPAFYSRFGFVARRELVYPGIPPQYFQAISFSGNWPEGEVAYHEAFTSRP